MISLRIKNALITWHLPHEGIFEGKSNILVGVPSLGAPLDDPTPLSHSENQVERVKSSYTGCSQLFDAGLREGKRLIARWLLSGPILK